MRTLFPAFRVTDLDASLSFYRSLGYEVVGTVGVEGDNRLVMLALPGWARGAPHVVVADPDGYRLELVQWPDGHPAGMTREDFAGLGSHVGSDGVAGQER